MAYVPVSGASDYFNQGLQYIENKGKELVSQGTDAARAEAEKLRQEALRLEQIARQKAEELKKTGQAELERQARSAAQQAQEAAEKLRQMALSKLPLPGAGDAPPGSPFAAKIPWIALGVGVVGLLLLRKVLS